MEIKVGDTFFENFNGYSNYTIIEEIIDNMVYYTVCDTITIRKDVRNLKTMRNWLKDYPVSKITKNEYNVMKLLYGL